LFVLKAIVKYLVADATLFDFIYFFGFIQYSVATNTLDIHYFAWGCVVEFLEVDWKLVCSGAELL
jgi:hypothetical protein